MNELITIAGEEYTRDKFDKIKNLVIDKLQDLPVSGRLSILSEEGVNTFNKFNLIQEVREETPRGLQIIESYMEEIKELTSC